MNVQNRYRGRRDIPLDAQGYQDAVDAAIRLSGEGLTAVYTGPLRRTISTAQIIADEARVPDIRILHGLINVDYGAWEGLTAQEAEMYDPAAFDRYRISPATAICPNGERLSDAQRRIMDAIALMGERHRGETVVAVTHAVMIRLAVFEIEKIDGEEWRIPLGRGSLTRFEVARDRITVSALPEGGDID
ncbi:MAG: phosphoserine phosphatase [Actinomycetota bacterium]|jgi:broad specificity phosphatase PhoE|nr:phosphoserine phosphatase [Actinomycetota bacterium]